MALAYGLRLFYFPKSDAVMASLADDRPQALLVRIIDEPNQSAYQIRAKARVAASCDLSGTKCADVDAASFIQISYSVPRASGSKKDSAASPPDDPEIGDTVLISGQIREMSFSQDQQSLKNFFKKEKTFYEVKGTKIIHVEKAFSIKRQLVRFRKSIERSIADALPRPHSDLAAGLVVSGKGSMSKSLLEKFKRVGLIHIVVLSGSNVSIIAAALMSSLGFLPRAFQIVFSLAGMSLFAVMTGAAPPVVRSVLMSSIPLIVPVAAGAFPCSGSGDPANALDGSGGKTLQKKSRLSGATLLFFTGYAMCLFNPMFLLYDISFQLSFMATLGLVLYTEPISRRLGFLTDGFGLREIVASSLGTQVLVAPLLLQISGSLSTVFLAANILVLPLLPIVMFFVFLVSLTSFIIPPLAPAAAFVSWCVLEWILRVTDLFSGISFASVEVARLGSRGVILAYVAIFSLTGLLKALSKTRSHELVETTPFRPD